MPGWDTHGMPIETAIQKQGVKRNEMPVPEFRDKCRAFALEQLDKQRTGFKRLGVMGEWDNPYVTLKPEFEAAEVEVFGAMAKKGLIYQGLKPTYWCPTCETALAEAEVEYADDPVTTIFVKFQVHDDKGKLSPVRRPLQDVLRHLDHHHLDVARQHGHLPEPPAGVCAGQGQRRDLHRRQ